MRGPASPPLVAVREAVTRALAEDLGPLGDLTSALLPPGSSATATVVARRAGVLAGTLAAGETFHQVDPAVAVEWTAADGDHVSAGQVVAHLWGPLASLLMAERTALNFLSHLSGVATLTRRYALAARPAVVRDTRKTVPGLRALQKAAVRAGGGVNHRGSLSDGLLVKDNHLGGLTVSGAVEAARLVWPGRPVQVECDTADQVTEALAAGADLLLLDNMTPAQVAACVAQVKAAGRPCPVEVSGGVDLDNVGEYAAAGADLIAVGALTHSAPALDLAMDLAP